MIPFSLKPLPALFRDLKIGIDDSSCGNTPQTDDDFRFDQHQLISEIIQTGLLFILMGVTLPSVGGMILIGLFQFGLPYICLAEGLVGTPPVAASLISMIEPVLNPILAAIFVHERLGTLSLIGAAIVIIGSLIYNVLKEFLKQKSSDTYDQSEEKNT